MSEYEYKRRDDTIIRKLVNSWPLILAFATTIAMAVTVKDKVDNHEVRIQKIENAFDAMDGKIDRLVEELIDKKR